MIRKPARAAVEFVAGDALLCLLVLALPGCDASKSVASLTAAQPAVAVSTPVPPNLPPLVVATPGPNAPVLQVRTNPSPARGAAPLDVNFNMCKSYDPDGDKLTFSYDFGDGQKRELAFCRHDHLYTAAGSYAAMVCASDGRTQPCRALVVSVF